MGRRRVCSLRVGAGGRVRFIQWRVADAPRGGRAISFLVICGRRWPSSGVGFAATGWQRRGDGSPAGLLSASWSRGEGTVYPVAGGRRAAGGAGDFFFGYLRAALAELGGRFRRDRLATAW